MSTGGSSADTGAEPGAGAGAGAGADDCRGEPGAYVPVIDRNRCGAKGECVLVCPYRVFEVRTVDEAERSEVGLRGRLKLWLHRGQQAHAVRPQACHACGLCVSACPERAIRLRKTRTPVQPNT